MDACCVCRHGWVLAQLHKPLAGFRLVKQQTVMHQLVQILRMLALSPTAFHNLHQLSH